MRFDPGCPYPWSHGVSVHIKSQHQCDTVCITSTTPHIDTPPNSLYYSANRRCPKLVMKPRVLSLITALCSPSSLTTPIGDDQYYPPPWAQNQAWQPEGLSDFVDGSGPIFSMYLEMAQEEDRTMAESWTADADGTLVFVRLYLLVSYFQLTRRPDCCILRCCRLFAFGIAPGSATEPAGHIQLLPCQHIPASCRPESTQYFHFPPYYPSSILSTDLCCLGERTLVFELGDQY